MSSWRLREILDTARKTRLDVTWLDNSTNKLCDATRDFEYGGRRHRARFGKRIEPPTSFPLKTAKHLCYEQKVTIRDGYCTPGRVTVKEPKGEEIIYPAFMPWAMEAEEAKHAADSYDLVLLRLKLSTHISILSGVNLYRLESFFLPFGFIKSLGIGLESETPVGNMPPVVICDPQ